MGQAEGDDDPPVETDWGSGGENCCNLFNAKVERPGDPAAVEWRGIALYRAITIISIATRRGSSTIICIGGLTTFPLH